MAHTVASQMAGRPPEVSVLHALQARGPLYQAHSIEDKGAGLKPAPYAITRAREANNGDTAALRNMQAYGRAS